MVGDIYSQKLNPNDPYFLHRAHIILSNNYLHDQTRQDKDRMYAQIYFAISLILAIIPSYLANDIKAIPLISLSIILCILLIGFAVNYRSKRKKFWSNREKMKATFKNFGLEWKD